MLAFPPALAAIWLNVPLVLRLPLIVSVPRLTLDSTLSPPVAFEDISRFIPLLLPLMSIRSVGLEIIIQSPKVLILPSPHLPLLMSIATAGEAKPKNAKITDLRHYFDLVFL